MRRGPALVGLATGGLAVLLSIVQPGRGAVSPKDPPGMRGAVLVDLCTDENISTLLVESDHASYRRVMDCADPDAFRYVVETPLASQKWFDARDVEEAKAWAAAENARIRATFHIPGPDAFFAATDPDDNGCRSRGLKEIPEVAFAQSFKADVDGDAETDRVVEYAWGSWNFGSNQTRLRVELASGTVIDEDTTHEVFNVRSFYGATDLDDNERSEVWFEPTTNKPGAVSLFVFHKCRVQMVRERDTMFLNHMSGRPGQSLGLTCTDSRIIETTVSEHVDDPYGTGHDEEEGWSFGVSRLEGTTVVLVESGSGDDLDERPSHIPWSGGFDCV